MKHPCGLATSCREWYGALKCFLSAKLEGWPTLLDRPVFFWSGEDFHYGVGKGFRGKCIGRGEKGILRLVGIPARRKRNAIGAASSHVGDLAISVSDLSIGSRLKNLGADSASRCLGGMMRPI